MNILLVITSSPWGSTLGVSALRFARAAVAEGMTISAVFFREDGVFQTRSGRGTESGTPDLATAWSELAGECATRLLVCRSSSQRNLPEPVSEPFTEAGLAEMMELVAASDRVITW